METISGRQTILRADETENPIAEQKLWVAVLAQALEDWQGDRINARHDAEHFLFRDQKDFFAVCMSAGIDPSGFRARLRRIQMTSPAPQPATIAA